MCQFICFATDVFVDHMVTPIVPQDHMNLLCCSTNVRSKHDQIRGISSETSPHFVSTGAPKLSPNLTLNESVTSIHPLFWCSLHHSRVSARAWRSTGSLTRCLCCRRSPPIQPKWQRILHRELSWCLYLRLGRHTWDKRSDHDLTAETTVPLSCRPFPAPSHPVILAPVGDSPSVLPALYTSTNADLEETGLHLPSNFSLK